MTQGEKLFIDGQLEEAYDLLLNEASEGSGRAMYLLGEYAKHGYIAPADKKLAKRYAEEGKKAGDLLAAMLQQTKSFAAQLLDAEGVTRLDVLNFISHGISKVDEFGEPLPLGEEEDHEARFHPVAVRTRPDLCRGGRHLCP